MVGAVRLLSACSTVSRGIPTNLAFHGKGCLPSQPLRRTGRTSVQEGVCPESAPLISVAPWEGGSFHTQLWFQPQLQRWSRVLPEPSIGRVEDGEVERTAGRGSPWLLQLNGVSSDQTSQGRS